jgi:hypothetical protein
MRNRWHSVTFHPLEYSFWLPLAPSFNYSIYYNGTQFNWVDQLVKAGYNFGPTTTYDGGTYNSYDAGIVGAQSSDVVNTELGILQPLVSAGSLHAVARIGVRMTSHCVGKDPPINAHQPLPRSSRVTRYAVGTSVDPLRPGFLAKIPAA